MSTFAMIRWTIAAKFLRLSWSLIAKEATSKTSAAFLCLNISCNNNLQELRNALDNERILDQRQ
jgi:hypothetical protein